MWVIEIEDDRILVGYGWWIYSEPMYWTDRLYSVSVPVGFTSTHDAQRLINGFRIAGAKPLSFASYHTEHEYKRIKNALVPSRHRTHLSLFP
jgi:hypothetical protein